MYGTPGERRKGVGVAGFRIVSSVQVEDGVVEVLIGGGRLRQRAALSKWIWDLDEMVQQTRACRTTTWEHNGERVSLLGGETTIGDRALILSGTPQGTVFGEVPLAEKMAGFVDWLLGGWATSIPDHAVDNYIGDAHEAGIYLQPGDRVTMHVDYLGVIDTKVIE